MNIPKFSLCHFKLKKLGMKAFVKSQVPKYTMAQELKAKTVESLTRNIIEKSLF